MDEVKLKVKQVVEKIYNHQLLTAGPARVYLVEAT